MITTIARRELLLLFASPLPWLILAVVEFLVAWVFFTRVELFLENQSRIASLPGAPGLTDVVVAPTLGATAIVVLLLAPLLTMRSFAEEQRNGTLVLLQAAPTRTRDLVLGKFLGLQCFFLVLVLLVWLPPASLLLGGSLDFGQCAGAALAMVLLTASFAAIGLFTSSLTSQPAIAAATAAGLMLLLWLLGAATEPGTEGIAALLGHLSLLDHYQHMLRGVLAVSDAAYYVIVTGLFLALTGWRLEMQRLQS